MNAVLFGLALKASAILLLAAALALALRHSSAAVRHLVWVVAITSVTLLPVVSLALPAWGVAELPRWMPQSGVNVTARASAPQTARVPDESRQPRAESSPEPEWSVPPAPAAGHRPTLERSAYLAPAWLLGTLGLLAWLAVGLARLAALGRASDVVQADPWVNLLRALERQLDVHRPVTIRRSRTRTMPMTWGMGHPVILLPADADAWPAGRRRDVLLHELAHVKRHDFATQLVARVACAFYWFHPLVWLAARRLRVERERACDDYVIRGGRRASDYAGHLLDIARSLSAGRAVSVAGVAMACRSHLADRLLDVLDVGRNRGAVSRRVAVPVWVAAAFVVLPLGALAPDARPVRSPAASATPDQRPPATEPTQRAADLKETVTWATGRSADTLQGCGDDTKRSSTSISDNDDGVRRRTTVRTVIGRCEVLLQAEGKFTVTADFTDIGTVARGGEVVVETDDGAGVRRLEVRPGDGDGGLEREYTINRAARPFDADARAWLAETLTFLLRRSGLYAEERAQWILEHHGITVLIEEIALLRGDYARRRYYQAAVGSGQLDVAGFERLVTRAGQEIESDHELAKLLLDIAGRQPLTVAMQAGFVAAAKTIGSDYERRRVLEAVLSRPGLTPAVTADMLDAAHDIRSDYELAQLLINIQRARPVDEAVRGPFFTALGTIRSGHEHRRVLATLLDQPDVAEPLLVAALASAKAIVSDYELAEFLVDLVRDHGLSGAMRAPFFDALGGVRSAYERRRVLRAVLEVPEGPDKATVSEVLKAARGIRSDFELAELLVAVTRRVRIDDSLRPAFEEAASTIGSSHENDRVMAALARSQGRGPAPQ